MNDPRVFFAAERTLLAWIRTGITVMGLGFLVARFGLFVSVMRGEALQHSWGSTFIGVGLVVLGAVSMAVAAWHHVRYCRTLPIADRPSSSLLRWSVWFSFGLAFLGLVLAVYLFVRSLAD